MSVGELNDKRQQGQQTTSADLVSDLYGQRRPATHRGSAPEVWPCLRVSKSRPAVTHRGWSDCDRQERQEAANALERDQEGEEKHCREDCDSSALPVQTSRTERPA